ncbi:PREDICTED: keratin-associated protein 5-2-like [Camelina sativa]|uniref:Keratin-associated protein 5-2-like n=1 Tax=Camelina sativa TaxID=90675 RepID=A0ABM1RNH0_CAMSA|nr:PREDICTED: keratin-associated protein 5-2-like [Camelina sativa]
MGNLKSLALLALLFSLSLAVFADTSTDATHAKDDVKPSTDATDAVEPQQRGRGGCRYGCCGSFAYGRCSACCSQPQTAEVEAEANDVVVEPQQGWGGGGCRYGCCGGWWAGRCRYCCSRSQAEEAENVEANVVEPQQRGGGGGGGGGFGGGRGGCRYGCCGGWWRGRCRYCCTSQAEANEVVETVEPQQRRGCRYGCCGSYAYGQCSACCSKKMGTEGETKKAEAKP